jgi:hypothetical protein
MLSAADDDQSQNQTVLLCARVCVYLNLFTTPTLIRDFGATMPELAVTEVARQSGARWLRVANNGVSAIKGDHGFAYYVS